VCDKSSSYNYLQSMRQKSKNEQSHNYNLHNDWSIPFRLRSQTYANY